MRHFPFVSQVLLLDAVRATPALFSSRVHFLNHKGSEVTSQLQYPVTQSKSWIDGRLESFAPERSLVDQTLTPLHASRVRKLHTSDSLRALQGLNGRTSSSLYARNKLGDGKFDVPIRNQVHVNWVPWHPSEKSCSLVSPSRFCGYWKQIFRAAHNNGIFRSLVAIAKPRIPQLCNSKAIKAPDRIGYRRLLQGGSPSPQFSETPCWDLKGSASDLPSSAGPWEADHRFMGC